MSDSNFFENQTPSSRIKASIISEYFPSYCKIIVKKYKPQKLRYVDLFAGPGLYKDGNHSTPLLIAKKCYEDPFLRENVWLIFNDMKYGNALKDNFQKEFQNKNFVHAPFFGNKEVGKDQSITDFLIKNTHSQKKNETPTLLFIDPFGYKGIETKVLAEFLKNWGNEIFLFVNIKRIHPALENDKFEPLMKELFPTTFEGVRNDRRYKSNTAERINLIVQSLGKEYENILKEKVYYTAFKFQEEDIDATSHYILHITKGSRGFDLVKQIYNDFANVGTVFDGINTYTFDSKLLDVPTGLFDLSEMNIEQLKEQLYVKYRNKSITAFDLFETEQKDSLYSRPHYTQALRKLVDENKLVSTYTDGKLHQVSVLLIKECKLKFN